jgi:hypothetical protein
MLCKDAFCCFLICAAGLASCAPTKDAGTSARDDSLGRGVMGNADLDIPDAERSTLEKSALLGDASAAFRLYKYSDYVTFDHTNARYWLQIAAENGDVAAMHILGRRLLHDTDHNNKIRGRYWSDLADKNGYKYHPI